MKDSPDLYETHVLIVTGPARDRLYQRFSGLFAGRGGVEVIRDRRLGERRHASQGPRDGERRKVDRRRRRPDWVVPPS